MLVVQRPVDKALMVGWKRHDKPFVAVWLSVFLLLGVLGVYYYYVRLTPTLRATFIVAVICGGLIIAVVMTLVGLLMGKKVSDIELRVSKRGKTCPYPPVGLYAGLSTFMQ